MSSVDPINTAVQSLRDYLLANLPAKVTALNLLRAPVLKTPIAGPFTIPAGAVLRLSTTRDDAAGTSVMLTSGSRTATQVAADITTAAPPGISASADTLGRLLLTGTAPVSGGDPRAVTVLVDNAGTGGAATGSNAAIGFDPGGEFVLSAPLVSPTSRGVCDGFPSSVPDMGQGFWIIIGDRKASPTAGSSLRNGNWDVTATLHLYKPDAFNNVNRDRTGITAVIRAVSEVLLPTDGRYLGRQVEGDIKGLEIIDPQVFAQPFRFQESPDVLHDVATLNLRVRVFQDPPL